MKLLHLLHLASSAAVMANPVASRDEETKDVKVIYLLKYATSESLLEAWTTSNGQMIGQACSNTLDSGDFANSPITFTVDAKKNAGNVTVGSQTYNLHEDPSKSGGITCQRIANADEFIVSCSLTLQTAVRARALSKRDTPSCFTQDDIKLYNLLSGFESGAHKRDFVPAAPRKKMARDTEDLEKRQGACGTWSSSTHVSGDGDPHQNPLNVQLSENMDCSSTVECSIGHDESKSFTVGWSASVSGGGWIDAGFEVQESIETGNQYTCYGNPGDFMCMWKNQAQTAYTVHDLELNQCTQNVGSDYIMWSPNQANRGGYYYCVYGTSACRAQGDKWLDTNGRAGGP